MNPLNLSSVGTHGNIVGSGAFDSPSAVATMYNDFNGQLPDPFYNIVAGAGASIIYGSYAGVGGWGIANISTGTTGTGYGAIRAANSAGSVQRYDSTMMSEARVKLGTALSTAGERFTVRVGASDSDNADSTNGFYFRYSDNINSGKWQCVTRRGAAESVLDTGITVEYSATLSEKWYRLKVIYPISGDIVYFFVDNLFAGSINTNLPDMFVPCSVLMTKSVGTTARNLFVDYIYGEVQFPNGR